MDATTAPHPRVAMATPVSGAVEGLPVAPCASLTQASLVSHSRIQKRRQERAEGCPSSGENAPGFPADSAANEATDLRFPAVSVCVWMQSWLGH